MNFREIVSSFVDGKLISFKEINSGHINKTTQIVVEEKGQFNSYIIQEINTYVFKDVEALMNNAILVTSFIKKKNHQQTLTYKKTRDGKYYLKDNEKCYRCYRFISGTITYNSLEDLDLIYEEGKGFGLFQNELNDFDSSLLTETIKDFHNTKKRYDNFKDLVSKDPYNRKKNCLNEINEFLKLEDMVTKLSIQDSEGKLKRRVVHNDTKCNNILFDAETKEALCVIDLDTVMEGLLVFDFGDAIRSACNNGLEDDTNLDNVYLDLSKFEAFSKGFITELKDSITKEELNNLSLGAITMTTEVGLRFLTDYLDKDKYFHTSYHNHNLVRAKAQLKLALDMIKKLDKMNEIISKIKGE